MKNPHRQVNLSSGDSVLTANLPDSPKLRVGNSVTLKDHDDPTRWWKIDRVSEHVHDKSELKTKWNNNI